MAGTAKKDIAIIGAGVAGLSIGWRLAQAGCKVSIYEKGQAGSGASHAAAGMLAAAMESEPGEEALLPFLLEAQKLWPGFARELKEASGLDSGYRESGTLFVAAERDDTGILRQREAYMKRHGLKVSWLTREELLKREKFLSRRASAALFSPDDHQADNRALTKALKEAAVEAGAILHENSEVQEIIIEKDRTTGIFCNGRIIESGCIVLAAGAWSASIKGIPEEFLPPVFPVKGQLCAVQMDKSAPLLAHVLWTPRVYMVPRADGRLIIGATMEDKGFDATITAGGMLHLLREAWDILPGIEELPLIESWAGFRPTSRDDAPILGPSGIENLVYATGQHRHGILMTPLIAALIRGYIIEGVWPETVQPFTMARFG